MFFICTLAILGAVFGFAMLFIIDGVLSKRAAFNTYSIVDKGYSGEAKAVNNYIVDFALGTLFGEKINNKTLPIIKDRSLKLVRRQSCNAKYWYCEGIYICTI